MDLRFNLAKSLILLMSLSITFYLAKITPFSPVYVIYLIAIFLFFGVFLHNHKISLTTDTLITLILLVYILVTQPLYYMTGDFLNAFIGLTGYIFIRLKRKSLDKVFLLKAFDYMLWTSILVLTIDSVYRLTHPGAPTEEAMRHLMHSEEHWFYLYKFNSFLFADSNTTGLIALILFFSIVTIENHTGETKYRYAKIMLFLLMLGSLSRAVLIAFFLGYLNTLYHKKKRFIKIVYAIIAVSLAVFVFIALSAYLSHDASFLSKFRILELTYKSLEKASTFDIMIGQGMGQAKYFLGVYSHLLLLTYFIELGVIGLFMFISFITVYIVRFNSLVWVPVLIVGLSYFLYEGTPFLFIPLALIANLIERFNNSSIKKEVSTA